MQELHYLSGINKRCRNGRGIIHRIRILLLEELKQVSYGILVDGHLFPLSIFSRPAAVGVEAQKVSLW